MEAREWLAARRSVSKLGGPGPDDTTLERIWTSALRAPDHGALRPWRILVVRGEARARLGALMAASALRERPELSPDELDRERSKPLRAPVVAVVVASLVDSRKIPETEQWLSAGCVAYGIVLAVQAEGFGAIWRTGGPSHDLRFHADMGLSVTDRIVGFVYLGTPKVMPPEGPRPLARDFVQDWDG